MKKLKNTDKKNLEEVLSLTPLQEGMLFHYLKNPAGGRYFEQLSLEISGEINREIFERAWNAVVEANQLLRTVFRWEKLEHPLQVVLKKYHLQPLFYDLTSIKAGEKKLAVEKIKGNDRNKKFDLREVPFRVTLCKIESTRYLVIIGNHHILYDGWSNGIILKEFFAAYNDLSRGRTPVIPAKTKFKEYIQWVRGRDKNKQKIFWSDYLQGFEDFAELAVKTGRGAKEDIKPGERYHLGLDLELKNRLEEFIKKHKITLAALLYSSWGILLQRYNRSDDVLFGTTVSGRGAKLQGIEEMVGLFIDTLPLRVRKNPRESSMELLKQVHHTLQVREEYETTPLVEISTYCRGKNRGELFDTLVVMENYPLERSIKLEKSELTLEAYSIVEETNYDLTLGIRAFEEIHLDFLYNPGCFHSETIERLAGHYCRIIGNIIENPGGAIDEIDLLSEEEKHRLLVDINDTRVEYPRDKTIHGLFMQQGERTPDHIALHGCMIAWMHEGPELQITNYKLQTNSKSQITNNKQDGALRADVDAFRGKTAPYDGADFSDRPVQPVRPVQLTYRELDEQSGRLAHALKENSVLPDTVVAIIMERSVEMITGILGILKSGAAYLPINPKNPAERIKYLLAESSASLLVTTGNLVDTAAFEKAIVNLPLGNHRPGGRDAANGVRDRDTGSDDRDKDANHGILQNLAYIIYTSGSTGNPKGVPITHSNFSQLIHWGYRQLGIGAKDRVIQNLSYYFDWSVWEIFIALTTGAALYMITEEVLLNPEAEVGFIREKAITVLHITPTQFQYLVNVGKEMPTLRYLFIGAEKLTYDLVKRTLDIVPGDCRIFNMYGPTEATIIAAVLEVPGGSIGNYRELAGIPIGRPVGNLELLVLDRYLNLCPIDVPGELHIGGAGLARGYLNNPELTADKFCLRRPGTFLLIGCKSLLKKQSFLRYRENYGNPRRSDKSAARWHEVPSWVGAASPFLKKGSWTSKNFLLNHSLLTTHHSPIYKTGDPAARGAYKSNILYKTGDLVRQHPDGNIEFLGRIDTQVKIRGFRIELGEIESRLSGYEGIKEAVVLCKEDRDGEKYLCAYLVSSDTLSSARLREYLAHYLPDYMIPSYFVRLEGLPLTSNGKVDLKALPGPEEGTGATYVAPRDEIERQLAEIWAEVLGAAPRDEKIGIYDNFFRLGGHSLKAIGLINRIYKTFDIEIPMSGLFNNPTIRGMAQYLDKIERKRYSGIEAVEKREYYELSPLQERFFIFQEMEPGEISYNISEVMVLEGAVSKEKFAGVFKRMIRRHESFRTSFHLLNGEPVQRIHDEVDFEIEYYDAAKEGTERSLTKVFGGVQGHLFSKRCPWPPEAIIKNFIRPFDFSRAPLARVGLIKVEAGKHIFIFDIHHLIADGVSMGIMIKEFLGLYAGKELPPLRVQYKEYVRWKKQKRENKAAPGPGLQETALNLPLDFPRPAVPDFKGKTIEFVIDDLDRVSGLLSVQEGITLYMVLLAAFNVFLARLSSQENIVVGSPIAGRQHSDLEGIIGLFINTLVLQNFPVGHKRFSDFLVEVKNHALEAFENQDCQYDELMEKTTSHRGGEHNHLYSVMFVLQNMEMPELEIPGLKVTREVGENLTSKFDMTLYYEEFHTVFKLEYSTSLFKPETMDRFIGYFRKVISGILEDPHKRIEAIEILSPGERHRLLYDFNDTGEPFPREKTVYQLIREQEERTPDKIALAGPGKTLQIPGYRLQEEGGPRCIQLTYRELNHRSDGLADRLRGAGVRRGQATAFLLEPSLEIVVGIQAILKAGGAYLPIDPGYPPGRVTSMLEDSGASLLLTAGNISAFDFLKQGEIKIIMLDKLAEEAAKISGDSGDTGETGEKREKEDNLAPAGGPGDLIYIIFTSGSTGKPKGAGVYHRGFMNLMHWFVTDFGLGAGDRNLLLTSVSFDLTQKNLYASLLTGGIISIAGFSYFEPAELLPEIQRDRVTWINCTPSMFYRLVEYEETAGKKQLASLRYVFLGGEPVSFTTLIDWMEKGYHRAQIVNTYGPTECTDICAAYRVLEPRRFLREAIPLGPPIYNVQLFVVDKNHNLVPPGVEGELLIGGEGVGWGYVNDRELTSHKFIRHSFGHGDPERLLYKTGDIVKWQPGGNLEFIGRMDHQVKIRGFRIELGEIEGRLLEYGNIKEVAVIDSKWENRDAYLCAYIVPGAGFDAVGGIKALKEFLKEVLPDYMIPSAFVVLERMPLSSNQKIDRKALPLPVIGMEEKQCIPPRGGIEEILAAIWSEVLGIKKARIGIDGNFFELGGHSLKAAALAGKIYKTLEVRIPLGEIFKTPTIRALARYIEVASTERYQAITAVEKREYYLLSPAQVRLYLSSRMEEESTAYNIPGAFILEGDLEKSKLENIFDKLIHRHESFRTSFIEVEDVPVQRVHHDVELTKVFAGGPGGRFFQKEPPWPPEAVISNFIRPFDLSKAPLLRVGFMPLSISPAPARFLLMIDMHHIISDGISMSLLIKDFAAYYRGEELPAQAIRYKDFSNWQNRLLKTGKLRTQEEYWQKVFEEGEELPVLDLPADYKRPAVRTFEGNTLKFALEEGITDALKSLALKEEATLFMLLLSVTHLFLSKLGGREEIIVGSPIAGRRHEDLQQVIGMFVNTLPLRNISQGEKSFNMFLAEVKERTLAAFENQEYPFEKLVEKVSITRDAGRNPLFDVVFALQEADWTEIRVPGLKLEPYETGSKIAKFDITIQGFEIENRLFFTFEYNTRLFKEETVERYIGYFKKVINSVVENPGQKIFEIGIIPGEEMQRLLNDFNETGNEYPVETTLHDLFAGQVERAPDRVALEGPVRLVQLSYKELNERSGRLAHLLIEKGVGPDVIVGIMMERSVEMIIGILGILKAGGAYMPIDPAFPGDRIDYMLADSQAKLLVVTNNLTREGEKVGRWEGEKVLIEEFIESLESTTYPLTFLPSYLQSSSNRTYPLTFLPSYLQSSSNLAYVIYTSGTTGKPKGNLTTHANVLRVVKGTNYIDITGHDRVLQLSNYAFDGSVFDIYGALVNGASLVMVDRERVLAVERLAGWIKQRQVTVFFVTTALFNLLVEMQLDCFANTRKVLFGGERVSLEHSRKALEYMGKGRVIHVYGPTETTVYATYYFIDGISEEAVTIPIGRPIAYTAAYILDRYLRPVPLGAAGELYIGGEGLARGYLNNPELTADKFCLRRPGTFLLIGCKSLLKKQSFLRYRENYGNPRRSDKSAARWHEVPSWVGAASPFLKKGSWTSKNFLLNHSLLTTHHSPIYKTGDLVRQYPDGNIEFLDRIDTQVKIRGYRIELGEIEARLSGYEGIKEAVVLCRENKSGEKYLCAYFVSKDSISAARLREYLSGYLPGYMIPSYFVPLENLPLTSNGKLDRKALPEPEGKPGENYVPPRDEIEKQLVNIWAGVLGGHDHASIGIKDNFFELGGHSLKATVMVSKIHKALDVKVPLAEVFIHPTVERLAKIIRKAAADRYAAIEPAEKKEYYELSSAQKRLYILQRMEPGIAGYNIPAVFELEGNPEISRLEEVFKKLVQRHESFRTFFEMVGGRPVQRVHDSVEFEIEPLTKVFAGVQGAVFSKRAPWPPEAIIRDFIRPFELSRAPLLRVGLSGHPTQEGKSILMVDMHHIVSDGTSVGVLIKDFMRLYQGEELPGLRIRYRDYSEWHNRAKPGQSLKNQEKYWLDRLGGENPVLNLPTDNPRPLVQGFEGKTQGFEIGEKETEALKSVVLKEEVTLFMLLQAIFVVLLSKLSGQENIVIGTPVAARRHTDLQQIIGMFVNTLVLRNQPGGEKSFAVFLHEVKKNTLDAYENQEYSFEDLVEKASAPRDAGRNPLFDVMFILQNLEMAEIKIPGLELKPYEYESDISKFDLTLTGVEKGKALFFTVEYCTKLFKEETILRFINYFETIVSLLPGSLERRIAEISVMSEEEKQQVLYGFNETAVEYPGEKTIHRLFEEQEERTPDHIALVGEKLQNTNYKLQTNSKLQITNNKQNGALRAGVDAFGGHTAPDEGVDFPVRPVQPVRLVQLTYNELNAQSDRLAHALKETGVGPETIVGIKMNRSVELMTGLLGVLKAGGAYLPIDPAYPGERIDYMLKDSGAKVVLSEKTSIKSFCGGYRGAVFSKRAPLTGNLAYVIYTSGSTGKPKGVMVTHRGVHNFIIGMTRRIDFSEGKTILALTTVSFDIFVLETFLPLTRGLRVVIADENHQVDIHLLEELIIKAGVDMMQATPTRMQMFLRAGSLGASLANLKEILIGGESIPGKLPGELKSLTPARVYNMYGPTETTVWSTMKDLTRAAEEEIDIGKPIANTQVYILDRDNQPQPLGVTGDMYIGGDGLARGYLNHPELTAERFIMPSATKNPFEKGFLDFPKLLFNHRLPEGHLLLRAKSQELRAKFYQTGDLARWRPDGNIEFLGRKDSQVKIRGFRIELGEIENKLSAGPGIKEAVVIDETDTNGNKYLCAYIVWKDTEGQEHDHSKLREYLARTQPDYMIPAYFVPVEKIPLTANGKIDRKALPGIDGQRLAGGGKGEYAAPGTDMEKVISETWQQVLQLEKISIHDNFFEIGGNSLNILQVNHKLNTELKTQVPVMGMFRYPTVHALAQFLEQQGIGAELDRKQRAETLEKGKRDRQQRYQKRQHTAERIKRALS